MTSLKAKLDRELKERSGDVVVDRAPLVDFLYDLMRDHLPAGKVEALMHEVEVSRHLASRYTNGYLALYAQDVAMRLGHESEGMSEFESRVRNAVIVAKEKLSGQPGVHSDRDLKHYFMEGIFHIVEDTPR